MAGRAVYKKHAAVMGELGTKVRFYGLGGELAMVDGDEQKNIGIYKKLADYDSINIEVLNNAKGAYHGQWDYGKDQMTINGAHGATKTPGEKSKREFLSGYKSSSMPEHTYFHELGHAKFVPVKEVRSKYGSTREGKAQKEIAGQVSKYAQTDRYEFLAEYYAGWVGGRKYSKEVNQLFSELARENPWRKS